MPIFLSTDNSKLSCKAEVSKISTQFTQYFSDIFEAEAKYSMDRDAVAKVAQQCNMFVVYHKYPYLHADHAW